MKYRVRMLEHLGLDREEMPQFPKGHMQELLDGLKADGIATRYGKMLARDLKQAQGELNPEKIHSMAQEIKDGDFNMKPLLVSRDNFILDGHHRWAAAQVVDSKAIVPVLKIDLDFHDLLKYANQFSGPKKDVDEARRRFS